MSSPPLRDEAAQAIYHAADPILGTPKPWDELSALARMTYLLMADAGLAVVATRIEQLRPLPVLPGGPPRWLRRSDVLAALGVAPATPEPPRKLVEAPPPGPWTPRSLPTHDQEPEDACTCEMDDDGWHIIKRTPGCPLHDQEQPRA